MAFRLTEPKYSDGNNESNRETASDINCINFTQQRFRLMDH